MIAEGSLHNPALFHGINPTIWEVALEYLQLAKLYPCPISYARGHIFKLCHHCLIIEENKEIRQKIATANNIDEFTFAVLELKDKYEVNPVLEASKQVAEKQKTCSDDSSSGEKRPISENAISRKKMKKLQKNPEKQFGHRFLFHTKKKNQEEDLCAKEIPVTDKTLLTVATVKENIDISVHKTVL
ncbi:unnamed protein product [Larinioides sclopetarius]